MRRLQKHLGQLGLLAAAGATSVAMWGCSSDEEDGACISLEQYFAEQLWAPELSQTCIGCHNPTGAASQSSFVLDSPASAGYLETNLKRAVEMATLEQNGESLLLLKPSMRIAHEGGKLFEEGSETYKKFEKFVALAKDPPDCETTTASYFAGVELMSPTRLFRKASLNLAGRLPTEEEIQRVEAGGMDEVNKMVLDLMEEEPFYERIRLQYNDSFLTDMYLNGDSLDLLGGDDDEENYYNPFWFEEVVTDGDNGYTLQDPAALQKYGANNPEQLYNLLRARTVRAVARGPVELIAYVVRNNRPFTEVVSANYVVVNPYSARAYGVFDQIEWKNDADPFEFHEATLGEAYHAGVLSDPMWLTRHPTTDTNRNRHRARMVYFDFLGTDILKTAERPIDPTKITDFNPTMNNPNCTVCHAALDPVAGAFMNYQPNDDAEFTWFQDMRPPGFGDQQIPFEQYPNALSWLGREVAKDPRFSLSAVYNMFRTITGQEPLLPPDDPEASDYTERFQAYLGQYNVLNKIAKDFEASGYNVKLMTRDIIMSPYFRAENAAPSLSGPQMGRISEVGMGHFLTPEQLNTKLQNVLGFHWGDNDGDYFLMDRNQYHILYGGIDSMDVTKRIKTPNGVMANIADRMANEASCFVVPSDFALPQEQRVLFPHVQMSFEPKDANGFDVVPAMEAIRLNAQHLHAHLLGEERDLNDPEIDRTVQLFIETWEEGKAGMASNTDDETVIGEGLGACDANFNYLTGEAFGEDEGLSQDEFYTVRAWMAVTTYLLSDYTFIHE